MTGESHSVHRLEEGLRRRRRRRRCVDSTESWKTSVTQTRSFEEDEFGLQHTVWSTYMTPM